MPILEKNGKLSEVVGTAIKKHGKTYEALIPILCEINREFGHIPAEAYAHVSQLVRDPAHFVFVSQGHLYSLASFYHMLSTQPLGKHVVRFCESAPCHVMGAREVFDATKETLGLNPGETSPDGQWSIITTSCLGLCDMGPVMLVDGDLYSNIQPEQIPDILGKYS